METITIKTTEWNVEAMTGYKLKFPTLKKLV